MYAIKEAVIAREHAGAELECTIFNMDIRTPARDLNAIMSRQRTRGFDS